MTSSLISAHERLVSNYESFRAEAAFQRCCRNPACETPSAEWDPHHVIYEQHLRSRGLPKYCTYNALRLCKTCHQRHHKIAKLPLTCLLDHNIEYGFLVMGDAAFYYFKRYYSGEDPRLAAYWTPERTLDEPAA